MTDTKTEAKCRINEITFKFDRSAEGGGVEALCTLENGRAFLEWKFHLEIYSKKQFKKIVIPTNLEADIKDWEAAEEYIRLRLTDRENNPVLECVQFLREEEPLQSILPKPEVWRGVSNPYLYKAEAVLADRDGNCLDRIAVSLPLRHIEGRNREGKEEILLNGEILEQRMVHYILPETGNPAQWQRLVLEDLGLLRKLGANCISLDGITPHIFAQICDRLGFMVFRAGNQVGNSGGTGGRVRQEAAREEEKDFEDVRKEHAGENTEGSVCVHAETFGPDTEKREVPVFRGIRNSFFCPGRKSPGALFYYYMAKWSQEAFVYLVPESLKRLDDGNYTVMCYSNCGKVALYTDGRLFEFKAGEVTFLFSEIPCRKPTVMLTAEADGCTHSLSIHKSFTKQSRNDDIFPLE